MIVIDKGAVIRSGSGGAGVDHWGGAYTNPCSKITPDEAISRAGGHGPMAGAYGMKHLQYITFKESWDAALDMEQWGMAIRDEDDEFVGAEFRDEETRLLFAYDYDTCTTLRVQGADVKVYLHREMKRLGITILDRVMATSLLTEGGKAGGRVIGATGLNVRTGEFYVLKAKATVLTTGQPLRIWVFNTELAGLYTAHDDPNCAGDGCAIAWKAGAEFALMERSMQTSGPLRYPAYGTGNSSNTWYGCTIVDSNGKEIPYVDSDGNVLKTVAERFHPKPGMGQARLIPDLAERIRSGEFVLPFYADLPSMPEHERRAIFGLMVCHEGKTRIPIYKTYTEAGFDPDQDMLQANLHSPEVMGADPVWWDVKRSGASAPQWRETAFGGGGGLVVDWDMRTNLEGLYAAGNQLAGYLGHVSAAATGRYAGRKMAEYVRSAPEPVADRTQVETEKIAGLSPGAPTGGGRRRYRLEGTAGGSVPGHAGLLRTRQERGGAASGSRLAPVHQGERGGASRRPEPARTLADARSHGAHDGGGDDHAGLAGPPGQQQGPGLLAGGLPGCGSARVGEVCHHPVGRRRGAGGRTADRLLAGGAVRGRLCRELPSSQRSLEVGQGEQRQRHERQTM